MARGFTGTDSQDLATVLDPFWVIFVLFRQQTSVLSQQKTSGSLGVILGWTKMISTFFLHLKRAKWHTPDGADGADGVDGAPEMQPQAAAWSLVPHAPGVRIT